MKIFELKTQTQESRLLFFGKYTLCLFLTISNIQRSWGLLDLEATGWSFSFHNIIYIACHAMEEDRSKTKVAKVKIWELTTSCKDFGLLLQRHLNARDNSIKTCQNFHTPSIQQTNNYCFELLLMWCILGSQKLKKTASRIEKDSNGIGTLLL